MSSLTFTLIQTDLHWENPLANLQMLEDKINSIKESTEVIVLPEMFTTGFSMQPEKFAEGMNGEAVLWLKKMARQKKSVITGSLMIKEDGKFYNRLLWMLPNGEYGCYDKRHLFAYANEDKHYTRGNKRLIASVKGWRINLQVCYDLRFPVWARQAPSPDLSPGGEGQKQEYDVLVFVANWPEKRSLAWKTLLQARAIENQCYVIGVNRVGEDGNGINYAGDSMIIDPLGEILYQKTNDEDVFTYTLEKEKLNEVRNKFPFMKDSDSFIINI